MTTPPDPAVDPFPDPFQFDHIVRDAVRSTRRRSRGDDEDAFFRGAVGAFDDVMPRLHDEARRTWEDRRRAEHLLGAYFRQELAYLDTVIGLFTAGLRRLEKSRPQPPESVTYATSVLAVRGAATAHEISALLRAGFANGARARWRTLHEVSVIAHVLRLGNRGTAARFINHRWVVLARDRRRSDGPLEWVGPGPTPETMSRRFEARYGKPFVTGSYGWAAELTGRRLNVTRPTFHDLMRLVDLAGHRPRVHHAHHAVHVDSLGFADSLDRDGLLHAGASDQDIALLAWETSRALHDAWEGLIWLWQSTTRTRETQALEAFVCEALEHYEHHLFLGAVRFGEAEWPELDV
jgi:hypothetical protein